MVYQDWKRLFQITIFNKKKDMFNLKKLFFASALFVSFISSPLNANTKVLRVSAIPDKTKIF